MNLSLKIKLQQISLLDISAPVLAIVWVPPCCAWNKWKFGKPVHHDRTDMESTLWGQWHEIARIKGELWWPTEPVVKTSSRYPPAKLFLSAEHDPKTSNGRIYLIFIAEPTACKRSCHKSTCMVVKYFDMITKEVLLLKHRACSTVATDKLYRFCDGFISTPKAIALLWSR